MTTPKPLVYIAGPYSHPDPVTNTQAAVGFAERVLAEGIGVPVVPHLSMLWHLIRPHEIDFWYRYDLDVLAHCAALVRLPGASSGADTEVDFAVDHGIPVFAADDLGLIELAEHLADREAA